MLKLIFLLMLMLIFFVGVDVVVDVFDVVGISDDLNIYVDDDVDLNVVVLCVDV